MSNKRMNKLEKYQEQETIEEQKKRLRTKKSFNREN